MNTEHGLPGDALLYALLHQAVTTPPTFCHWQKAQPVTARRRQWEEEHGIECPTPLISPVLTTMATAAPIYNSRKHHSRGMLCVHPGWFHSISVY